MPTENLPWILLLLPLFAAVLNVTVFRRWGTIAAGVSVLSVVLTLLGTFRLMGLENVGDIDFTPYHWIPDLGGALNFNITFALMIDKSSIGMMFIVTFVGALVHIFSLGYMSKDSRKSAYFAGLSIFMFSMTGIVLADNFAMMFIFWELVGVSSYILIGHWFEKNTAAEAAKKAFLVNRIGDFGFMIGILMIWSLTGAISFSGIESALAVNPYAVPVLTGATLLIFLGAVGKSAQMPLHVWLPDAMEGPTPVSALIHAATMVAAGVFMLFRIDFLFPYCNAGTIVAWVGGITAAFAAVCAIQQDDIKKILAYSTLSQLGYMVMAVGLSAGEAGMFHLYTHAFFKALLFLGAGAVIYAAHHEQNIWKMGGLAKKMPITFGAFAIGTLALIAFPGTSGFFSKEEILHAAYDKNVLLFWLAAAVAGLTAFYMTRLVVVAFLGKPRTDDASNAKEVSPVMWIPLALLAVLSIVSAYGFFTDMLSATVPTGDHHGHLVLIVSLITMIGGVGLAFVMYRGKDKDPLRIGIIANKFYIDEIYRNIVRWLQDLPAFILHAIDEIFINGLAVRGSAKLAECSGRLLRRVQSGNLQNYAGWFAVGVVVVLWLILDR
ncbi:MAG: NADH-quinone oxidoreductase subunit L [Verrucomicrobiales bacterium]|jgi:NADH-quinone oxidoreductase subunit L